MIESKLNQNRDSVALQRMRRELLQLSYAAEETEEVDQLRNQIKLAIEDILEGNMTSADFRLDAVRQRVNYLVGSRDTEPEIEVMPRSERRLILPPDSVIPPSA